MICMVLVSLVMHDVDLIWYACVGYTCIMIYVVSDNSFDLLGSLLNVWGVIRFHICIAVVDLIWVL